MFDQNVHLTDRCQVDDIAHDRNYWRIQPTDCDSGIVDQDIGTAHHLMSLVDFEPLGGRRGTFQPLKRVSILNRVRVVFIRRADTLKRDIFVFGLKEGWHHIVQQRHLFDGFTVHMAAISVLAMHDRHGFADYRRIVGGTHCVAQRFCRNKGAFAEVIRHIRGYRTQRLPNRIVVLQFLQEFCGINKVRLIFVQEQEIVVAHPRRLERKNCHTSGWFQS